MAFVTLPHALTAGAAENINHVQANLDEIVNEVNGSLDSTNLSGSAGITKAQLIAAVQEALFSAGDLKATAVSAAPSGWLMCDGSAVSRTTYATLFAAIGTTYGSGNGSTTFNVPDLRGRVPVGVDGAAARLSANDSLGSSGGAESASHSHTVNSHTHQHISPIGLSSTNIRVFNPSDSGMDLVGSYSVVDTPTMNAYQLGAGNTGSASERWIVTSSASTPGTNSQSVSAMQPYQVVNWMVKT